MTLPDPNVDDAEFLERERNLFMGEMLEEIVSHLRTDNASYALTADEVLDYFADIAEAMTHRGKYGRYEEF